MNGARLATDFVSTSQALNSSGFAYAEDYSSFQCSGCTLARCPVSEAGCREAIGFVVQNNGRLGLRLFAMRKTYQNNVSWGLSRSPNPRKAAFMTPAVASAAATLARGVPQDGYFVHKVKDGETLHSIARKYRVPVGDLARINNITDMDVICYDASLTVPSRPWVGSIRVAEVTPGVDVLVRTVNPNSGLHSTRKRRVRTKPEVSASVGGIFLQQPDSFGMVHGLEIVAAVGLLLSSLVCGMMLSFVWHTWTKAKSAKDVQPMRVVRKRYGRAQLRQRVEGALSGEPVMYAEAVAPAVLPLQGSMPAAMAGSPSPALGEGFAPVPDDEELVVEEIEDDMVRVDRPYDDILKSYDQMQDEYNKFLRDARVGKKGIMERNVPH